MMFSVRRTLGSIDPSSVNNRPFSYALAVAATVAAVGLSRLAFNVVGNRALGIALVGKANLILSVAILVGLPASSGLAMGMSRFFPIYVGTPEARRSLRSVVILTPLIVLLVLAPTLVASQVLLQIAASPIELTVTALWALLYAFYAVGRAILFAQSRVLRAFTLELAGLAAFGVGLWIAMVRNDAWWLPFTAYPIPVALVPVLSTIRHPPTGGFEDRRRFFRFTAFALLGSAAAQGVQYGSTIACGISGGIGVAGAWATLMSLASPALILPRSLSTFYLPRLSGLSVDLDAPFLAISREHQILSGLLALPAIVGLFVLGAFGLPLALSSAPDANVFIAWTLLCLMTFVTCRAEPIVTGIAALGFAGINATAAFIGCAAFGATWLLVDRELHGLVPVASALLIYTITVPVAASLIASLRGVEGRPRFVLMLGDATIAISGGLMLIGVSNTRVRSMAFIVAILGVALEASRLFWRRRLAHRKDATPVA